MDPYLVQTHIFEWCVGISAETNNTRALTHVLIIA